METFRFIICLALTLLRFIGNSQTPVESRELKKLSFKTYRKHPYGEALKTQFVLRISSYKPVDGGCISETSHVYKKESTIITSKQNGISIEIFGRRSPFMTQDSIKVGDKVHLAKICENLEECFKGSRENESINMVKHKMVLYTFREIPVKKINGKTKVKITRFTIFPED